MMVNGKKILWIIVALLLVITVGILNIIYGNIGFGTSLIVIMIAVAIARYYKEKRTAQLIAKGVNPQDERIHFISGLASRTTLSISIILGVIIMLLGSIGPKTFVNPYDFLGYCISIVLLIYIATFYYYNKKY
ncbi:MAG: DUF2178 domain-containing protein [Syntrophomonadaceae bacterium]|nr:DUF2178 domain-containing protein [Syntrophomonadaceae bacterium]